MSASLCFAWRYSLLRQLRLRAIRGSLICFVGAVCAACSTLHPPSMYVPFDPVFKEEISQTGTMPVLLFPDDPIKATYDESQVLTNVPYTGGGLDDVVVTGLFNLGIDAINSSTVDQRKKEAYQSALPVIEQLSSYDLKSDVAHALASEMKDGQWLKLNAPVAISQNTLAERAKQDLKKFDTFSAFLSSILPPNRSERFYLTVNFKQSVQADYAIAVRYQIISQDHGIVVFRNDAHFICPGASAQDWASWWVTNDGQRLRTAYSKGVQALAELIAFDLGTRNALDNKISIARTDTGNLTARCPEEWWK